MYLFYIVNNLQVPKKQYDDQMVRYLYLLQQKNKYDRRTNQRTRKASK